MLQPGESLDGYRVIRLIGSGGFGEVWLCQSEALGDFRALKFIPAIDPGRIEKEFDALCRYRTAAGQLRSPSIMPIEHVNLRSDGLFYIMPLADGYGADDPMDPAWCPLTMSAVIDGRRTAATWFTSEEIKGCITPVLQALQLLSDAGLVHRDVKPENILFLHGSPCLGDISLLGEDSHQITRRGTPGYSAPSWFVESGGHPDMYGAATTLYSLLTGNPPDKMGRSAFRWPPQGESSLSGSEKQEWQRIHRIIRRAVDDRPAERFRDFTTFAQTTEAGDGVVEGKKQNHSRRVLSFAAAAAAILLLLAGWQFFQHRQVPKAAAEPSQAISGNTPATKPDSTSRAAPNATAEGMAVPSTVNEGEVPEAYRKDFQNLEDALQEARKELNTTNERISGPVETAVSALKQLSQKPEMSGSQALSEASEILHALEKALETIPPLPTSKEIAKKKEPLEALVKKLESIPRTAEERVNYDWEVRPIVNLRMIKFDDELSFQQGFRLEQFQKIDIVLYSIEEIFGNRLLSDGTAVDPSSETIRKTITQIRNLVFNLTKLKD